MQTKHDVDYSQIHFNAYSETRQNIFCCDCDRFSDWQLFAKACMSLGNECYPNIAQHEEDIKMLEKDWPRYKDSSHSRLSQMPAYMANKGGASNEVSSALLWSRTSASVPSHSSAEQSATTSEDNSYAELYAEVMQEAKEFTAAYFKDIQFVQSRTNHHHHKMTKNGRVPLTSCQKKGKAQVKVCKHGFPKEKEMTVVAKVICRGQGFL
jgi:hypothetical protein